MASELVFGKSAEAPGAAARRRKHNATDRAPFAGLTPDENTTTNAEDALGARAIKALDLEYRARLWIGENPDAWAFMSSLALREARARRRFGSKWLVEEARRKDFADAQGGRTRISNTLSPAFARILVGEHPECRAFATLKRSILDEAAL